MKKVFISVPMRGRSKKDIAESITKMQKIAKILLGDDVVFINEPVEEPVEMDNIPMNRSIYFLGQSISQLSMADYCVGIDDVYAWHGCFIEQQVCESYGIPYIALPIEWVAPGARANRYKTFLEPEVYET